MTGVLLEKMNSMRLAALGVYQKLLGWWWLQTCSCKIMCIYWSLWLLICQISWPFQAKICSPRSSRENLHKIKQAKLSSKPMVVKRLRHHRNAKQPLKLLHFPSSLMVGGKLTDAPTHSWWPLQNHDAVFPSRISTTISSLLVHLVLVLARMRTTMS